APSGHPGPKNGDPLDVLRPEPRRGCPPPPGESDAFGAHRKCAAAIVQRWRTVRLPTALLFPRSDAPIFLARRNLPLGREPGCRSRDGDRHEHFWLCVQRRLACSAGDRPAGARVRSPVVWIAEWRATKTLQPIDKVSPAD